MLWSAITVREKSHLRRSAEVIVGASLGGAGQALATTLRERGHVHRSAEIVGWELEEELGSELGLEFGWE